MKCAFISDLHISSKGDDAYHLLENFFLHPKVMRCDHIYLLGDIFDFMIGEHKQYTDEYPVFFKSIASAINRGQKVFFIEGNHDFHFKRVVKKYLKRQNLDVDKFIYLTSGVDLELGQLKTYVCHGYEVDYFNKYFKRWYKIYTSAIMKILVSYIFPYFLLKKLASWASSDSKRRGKKTFDYQKMKEKYIMGAEALVDEKNIDVVVAGHTHIYENHRFESQRRYLNVGFPLKDKKFLLFENDDFSFIEFN